MRWVAPNYWSKKNGIALLLWPFSVLYRLIFFGKRLCYRLGILKTYWFSIPTIVVGNITVGGSGKTPFVIWLANWLTQEGFKVGLVSRGYGGKTRYPKAVCQDSDPREVGDEAMLIHQKTRCPMVVDPNRSRAVTHLLKYYSCQVVIADDGLQHDALARDIEVAVVNLKTLGNGFCLPAGPLREPKFRLKRVDFVVSRDSNSWHQMKLVFADFYSLSTFKKFPLATLAGKKVHAFAAIAHPKEFFGVLKTVETHVTEHVFPDHYFFKKSDFDLPEEEDVIIMMTEKDAVKCKNFIDNRFFCLPLEIRMGLNFKESFLKKLKNLNRVTTNKVMV